MLGEAASRVSTELKQHAPEIPWPEIVRMRNRLIHGYFDIDPETVWDTVVTDVPPLIPLLESLLTELEKASGG
ncbi:MAG: DUF86 domain-containing protein [Bryobacteraceae bacterium]